MLNRAKISFPVALSTLVILGSIVFAALVSVFTTQQSLAASSYSILSLKAHEATTLPLGVDGDPHTSYAGIPWVRLSYPTCGASNPAGDVLKNAIQAYHNSGIKVLLTICQQSSGPQLFDPAPLNDAAQGGADAVQCGNEEMKYDPPATRYVSPQNFARYFDLCSSIMHTVRPGIPIILGSLDPHVGWLDNQKLMKQVNYLDEMQTSMNRKVHPGGHWSWRSQIVGVIDSWHNGYPDRNFSSLLGLFSFWAKEFRLGLYNGDLGKHLWVIEGSGCFKGCGINVNDRYQVAVSHILTLIDDVQTTLRSGVPFFYFNGKDFKLKGILWPMGILDVNGHSKPLRQDLSMGARSLLMSCGSSRVKVVDQENLLAKMYNGCTLPDNYYRVLTAK